MAYTCRWHLSITPVCDAYVFNSTIPGLSSYVAKRLKSSLETGDSVEVHA